MRIKPIYALFVVLLFVGGFLVAELFVGGAVAHDGYTRVAPDQAGTVRIDVADLPSGDVRFFRFLNYGNQEVKFFVARDRSGTVQVAFDANEICYKFGRGYRPEGSWVTCNKCDKAFRIDEINDGGGGCKPIPLHHRVEGGELVLAEADVLQGWRYFH
jgi:uncharacterized membrane protein